MLISPAEIKTQASKQRPQLKVDAPANTRDSSMPEQTLKMSRLPRRHPRDIPVSSLTV